MLYLINARNRWELSCPYNDRKIAHDAGFLWDKKVGVWYTTDKEIAGKFKEFTAKNYYKRNKGNKSRKEMGQVMFVYYKLFFNTNSDAYPIILHAIREVSNRCDGAVMDDCKGFNSYDVSRADEILSNGIRSPEEAASAFRMVYKYRRQLSDKVLRRLNNIRKFALCLDF